MFVSSVMDFPDFRNLLSIDNNIPLDLDKDS